MHRSQVFLPVVRNDSPTFLMVANQEGILMVDNQVVFLQNWALQQLVSRFQVKEFGASGDGILNPRKKKRTDQGEEKFETLKEKDGNQRTRVGKRSKREGNGTEGKRAEGKGREGKAREGKGRQGKGEEREGRKRRSKRKSRKEIKRKKSKEGKRRKDMAEMERNEKGEDDTFGRAFFSVVVGGRRRKQESGRIFFLCNGLF